MKAISKKRLHQVFCIVQQYWIPPEECAIDEDACWEDRSKFLCHAADYAREEGKISNEECSLIRAVIDRHLHPYTTFSSYCIIQGEDYTTSKANKLIRKIIQQYRPKEYSYLWQFQT